MFLYLGNRTDVVSLGGNQDVQEGPNTVLFKRSDGTEFFIETRAFQILRRGVRREQPARDDPESKILLIKALRGLRPELGLRDAKEVVEYFMNNYSLEAGNSYGK